MELPNEEVLKEAGGGSGPISVCGTGLTSFSRAPMHIINVRVPLTPV